MKKFTKIILIITGVFVILGVAFIGAGSVMAGGIGVLNEQLRSGNMNFGNWHFDDGFYYYNDDIKLDVTNIVEDSMGILPKGNEQATSEFTENITKLEIDTDMSNITIKTADVEAITVSLKDGYEKYYEVETNGDILYVSYEVGGQNFKQGPKIIVEVPQQTALESIYIDTDLGEVAICDLEQLEEVEIEADLGDVRMENCKVNGWCTVDAALGNIVMVNSYFEKIDMSADLGNIEFSGTVEKDINGQADMGNIEVCLTGNESDYNIELSSDMGEVCYGDHKSGGMGGSHSSYQEHAVGTIYLNCDMGNVELSFQ